MRISQTTVALGVLLSCGTAIAQPYGYLSRSGDLSDRTEPTVPLTPAPNPSALAEAMEEVSQDIARLEVPEGLQGRVQTGRLPDIFGRNYQPTPQPRTDRRNRNPNANSGIRSESSRAGRRSIRSAGAAGSSTTSGSIGQGTATFVENAFLFDSNQDRELAAHELSNMFLVLTSELNAQEQGQSFSGDVDTELVRLNSVRRAQGLFLQLAMSFDNDTSGQLNSGEVSAMASCLQQNNLSLIGAAQQNSGGTNPAIPVQPGQVVPVTPINSASQPFPPQ